MKHLKLFLFTSLLTNFSLVRGQSLKLDTTIVSQKDTSKKKFDFKLANFKPKTEAGKRFVQSMLVPGLGQIKNKQYIYLPIIYGGAITGGYFVYFNKVRYNYFFEKRLEAFNGKKTVKIDKYSARTDRDYTATELKPVTDGFKRNIEITILGIALGWTMQAIQANVGYHLKTFDTKDDISYKLQPKIGNFGTQNGIGLNLTCSFTSKINFN